MSTSQKLWAGFGTLTALLMLFGVTFSVRLRSIEGQVDKMANVTRPRAAITRELEVDVVGYALAVRTFTQTDDPKFRQKAADIAADVDQKLAEYKRFISTERQQELAARFAELWRDQKDFGQVILESNDRPLGRADSERLAELRSGLENFLNGQMQAEAVESYNVRKESTFRDLRTLMGWAVVLLIVSVVIAASTSLAVGSAVIKSEQAVVEQSERLRTTLASIGDAVIATDTEGRITSMNAVAESLTRWSNPDAVGEPLAAVFKIVNETTRQTVENPAARVLREGVVVGLANHTILIAKDGTERPIDDSAAPIRCKEGKVVGCVLVFRDVTERRREESLLTSQNRVLEQVVRGGPLTDVLDAVCQAVERQVTGGVIATVLLADDGGTLLRPAAGGRCPGEYSAAINPVPVGPNCGSCGTAAYRGEPVIVADIASDPLWADYRHVALPHELARLLVGPDLVCGGESSRHVRRVLALSSPAE